MSNTLHIKQVPFTELRQNWGEAATVVNTHRSQRYGSIAMVYIRCNSKGVVNWNKAGVYSLEELIERNNVKILK